MRRHAKATSAIAAICGIVLCIGVSPALAAKGVVRFYGGNGAQGGQFSANGGPRGITVNQAGTGGAPAGAIYAVDTENQRVQELTEAGAFVRAFGRNVGGVGVNVCTVAASCVSGTSSALAGGLNAPQGIAVEQSTGNVYVSDQGNRRIDVFSASGSFEGAFGWKVDATTPEEKLQLCTTATGCQAGSSGSGAGQFGTQLGYLAVSPLNGHVLVADKSNRRIDELEPTLASGEVTGISFVRGYGWGAATGASAFETCTVTCHAPAATGTELGQFGANSPTGLAVDTTGKVYAIDAGNNRVQTFNSTGTPLGIFAEASLSGPPSPIDLTVDPANNHVLALKGCTAATCPQTPSEQRVLEFNSAGALLASHAEKAGIQAANGLAAVAGGGNVYVSTNSGPNGNRGILVLSSPPVPPTATIDPVTIFTGTTATFSGKVNPHEFPTEYHFEYSSDGVNWTKLPVPDKRIASDNTEESVSVNVAGLEAKTTYQVRLVATKPFGAGSATASTSFKTAASSPVITSFGYTGLGSSEATLEGTLNPENETTTYQFEYVSEADFAQSGYSNATHVPAPAGSISGGQAQQVDVRIHGLTPRTTYHFRLIASNGTGPATSADATFTTYELPTVGLPDGRAYEQVSPVDKNGNNVEGGKSNVRAAPSGDAITYITNGGVPGAEGSQDYSNYVATRGPGGWSTQGLLPPASTGRHAFVIGATPDLTQDFTLNNNFGESTVLWARDMASHQIVEIASNNEESFGRGSFAGGSADGSTSLFETELQLTPEAPPFFYKVYAWDRATNTLRLASVFNNGEMPEEGAFAGPYNWYEGNREGGGAHELMFTQDQNVISADGSRMFFTSSFFDQVYMRTNPTQPQSPLNGEGKCTDPTLACTTEISTSQRTIPDPNGKKPVGFAMATPDGSHAFLLSAGKLTDDATTGPNDEGKDLYRYDVDSGQLTDLVPDATDPAGAGVKGLMGISDDGSTVYFAAKGVLAPGATSSDCNSACNLYVWHEGTISFIARVVAGSQSLWGSIWEPLDSFLEAIPKNSHVSADGTTMVFSTRTPLTSYDNNGPRCLLEGVSGAPGGYENRPGQCFEIYRYHLGDAQVTCISCDPTGTAPLLGAARPSLEGGNASFSSLEPGLLGPSSMNRVVSRNLSADGNQVFFETPQKLVANDENGVKDVYEWEANGSGSCHSEAENGGCLFLLSSGTSPQPSYFGDASADGKNAFFFTGQPLVGQDRDELVDIYDARVGGGIDTQNPPAPSTCEGESCKGPPSSSPQVESPGTVGFSGPGDPPAKHSQGHRKKKHHRKHHKKRSKRSAKRHAGSHR